MSCQDPFPDAFEHGSLFPVGPCCQTALRITALRITAQNSD